MQPELIFTIIVIIYSIILHEIAHGYAAYLFGDNTAFWQNRLTLNPIPHIDIVGSLVVPAILVMTNSSFLAGWAKPVPVAEHNLKPYKLGSFVVSAAGVATNLALAIIFAIVGMYVGDEQVKYFCYIIGITNLSLFVFNLIPVPPADGYRIVSIFLSQNVKWKIEGFLQKYFIAAILISIFIAIQIFSFVFPLFQRILQAIIY